MEQRHKDAIRQNTVFINDTLMIDSKFLWSLHEKKVLTSNNMEEIDVEKTTHKKNTKFLQILPRRGPKAFEYFIEALVKTEQPHIAEVLDPELTRLIEARNGGGGDAAMRGVHSQETCQPQNPAPFSRQESKPMDEGAFMTIQVKEINPNEQRIRNLLADKTVYPVKSSKRGRAVIINNEVFFQTSDKDEKLSDREGSEYDVVNLDRLLNSLHFETKVHDNQSRDEILNILSKERKSPEHEAADAFIFCIFSHGAKGMVYGRDGQSVSIEDEICAAFDGKQCPALNGKPKIFIIQACQGTQSTAGIPASDGDAADSVHDSMQKNLKITESEDSAPKFLSKHHEKADMLIAYSTVAGYKSWRLPGMGSWYIRAIVDVFSNHAHEEHIVDLFTRVRSKVADLKTSYLAGDEYKQITKTDSTMIKNFFFFPGYTGQTS